MDMNTAIDAFEAMPRAKQLMVGALQEKWLTEDETGGEDGMWFVRAVQMVDAQ